MTTTATLEYETMTEPIQETSNENAAYFKEGLPGFPNEKHFVILQRPEERPFAWMKSTKSPEVAFVVTSPFGLYPDYKPDVSDHDLAAIGSPNPADVLVLTIVRVFNTSPIELHMNLKAPLIVNTKSLEARQVILKNESEFSERFIFQIKS